MSKGLKLYLKDGVEAFHRAESGINVELQSGRSVTADIVIPAIGGKSEISLEKDAGWKQ